jgi:hypothetical protein
MNDPFSTRIRRYIPWADYRALEASQATDSLVGRSYIDTDGIKDRIAILANSESSVGFVYFGERQWLEARLYSNSDISYSSWAASELKTTVFRDGFARTTDSVMGMCWKAHTDDLTLFWSPPQLSCAIRLQDVEVLVLGKEDTLPLLEASRVFDILHDLPYYLRSASSNYSNYGDVVLDALILSPQQSRWEMCLANEYGSFGAAIFDGQELVGFT